MVVAGGAWPVAGVWPWVWPVAVVVAVVVGVAGDQVRDVIRSGGGGRGTDDGYALKPQRKSNVA